MKQLLALLLSLTFWQCTAQENEKFNFGFETKRSNETLPEGWFSWGSYTLSIDSLSHTGKHAGKIAATEAGNAFGSIAYRVPANYAGSTIQLQGYMKTKDVEDGFAGLLLRVDGKGQSLVFSNMQDQNIKGTNDWKQYQITLDYPSEAEDIYVAGILSGKGEAWFDDFVVTIDGKDIQTLAEIEKETSKAQSDKAFDKGSSIVLPALTAAQLNNLTLLGRIWGFLKYHHPEIAKGNYNWDYELFRFLPRYMEAADQNQRDDLLIDWITALGEVPACETCVTIPAQAAYTPDHSWIGQQEDKLKNALQHVYKNRISDEHYYIEMAKNVGNPIFKNENAYADMPYPDAGFRLLSLYRYWNMIHYFFPYKHLADKDWDTVLKEYIPRFVHAKDELEYELAVLQVIADIQDTHANLYGGADKIAGWKGRYHPTFQTRFVEDKLVVTEFNYPDLQEESGLAVGDIIHTIDGKKIEEIVTERTPYYPASNKPTRLRNMAPELLRSNQETVEIGFTTADGSNHTKTLNLYQAASLKDFKRHTPQPPQSYKMLDNNIGYITLQTIKKEDIDPIKEKFENAKGIVVDIRNYPSTFVPFLLGCYFVSGSSPFVKFTNGSVENPGVFTFTKNLGITNEAEHYAGPVVVLLDERSQSQSEYTAMAFRAGTNTTIMGSTTAGADGNVSQIVLPGGLGTMISGIGIYYPDGTGTQRIGIVPDVEVKPTVEGIRNGKDELLDKAIDFILTH